MRKEQQQESPASALEEMFDLSANSLRLCVIIFFALVVITFIWHYHKEIQIHWESLRFTLGIPYVFALCKEVLS